MPGWSSDNINWVSALLSAIVPGLGLLISGYPLFAAQHLLLGGALGFATFGFFQVGGPGAGFLVGILTVFPWWVFQIFQSSFKNPQSLTQTWAIVWSNGHDIRFMGLLFFLAAVTDMFIILKNPEYTLLLFCTRPGGWIGTLAKLQSPSFHLGIGYGFVRLRRWGFFLYLLYASYGLLNASVNYACEGFGRIRTVFFLTLLVFTVFVIFRRSCFFKNFQNPLVPNTPF
jgi:hypothetical protein